MTGANSVFYARTRRGTAGLVPRKQESKPKTWVRLVREATKLTQEQFAVRVGSLRETVAKWEDGGAGGSKPGFKYVQKIRAEFPTEAAQADRSTSPVPSGSVGQFGMSELEEATENARAVARMSDPRSTVPSSNLEALFDRHARTLSWDDIKRLRLVATRVSKPGVVLSVDEWEEIAEAVLDRKLSAPAGGGTGG